MTEPTAGHVARRQKYFEQWADGHLAEEDAAAAEKAARKAADQAAAKRRGELEAELARMSEERLEAIGQAECVAQELVRIIGGIFERAPAERTVRSQLAERQIACSEDGLAKRLSSYVAHEFRELKCVGANKPRFGILSLPPHYPLEGSWVDSELIRIGEKSPPSRMGGNSQE